MQGDWADAIEFQNPLGADFAPIFGIDDPEVMFDLNDFAIEDHNIIEWIWIDSPHRWA